MAKQLTYLETVDRWLEVQAAIRHLTLEERALREGLFNGTFTDPKEGTNKKVLPDGRTLKAVHKIYRNVIEDQLPNLVIPVNLKKVLFRAKHDLVISQYRQLDPTLQKKVDKVLNIKPGLPTLEVVDAKPTAKEVGP